LGLWTIQAAPAAPGRLPAVRPGAGRPLALVAAALAALEFLIAAAGGRFALLSGLVLVLAPGLALVPLAVAAFALAAVEARGLLRRR